MTIDWSCFEIEFFATLIQIQPSQTVWIIWASNKTTFPETNSSHLPVAPSQKETIETIVFQPAIFMCYVSFREGGVWTGIIKEWSWTLKAVPTDSRFGD